MLVRICDSWFEWSTWLAWEFHMADQYSGLLSMSVWVLGHDPGQYIWSLAHCCAEYFHHTFPPWYSASPQALSDGTSLKFLKPWAKQTFPHLNCVNVRHFGKADQCKWSSRRNVLHGLIFCGYLICNIFYSISLKFSVIFPIFKVVMRNKHAMVYNRGYD